MSFPGNNAAKPELGLQVEVPMRRGISGRKRGSRSAMNLIRLRKYGDIGNTAPDFLPSSLQAFSPTGTSSSPGSFTSSVDPLGTESSVEAFAGPFGKKKEIVPPYRRVISYLGKPEGFELFGSDDQDLPEINSPTVQLPYDFDGMAPPVIGMMPGPEDWTGRSPFRKISTNDADLYTRRVSTNGAISNQSSPALAPLNNAPLSRSTSSSLSSSSSSSSLATSASSIPALTTFSFSSTSSSLISPSLSSAPALPTPTAAPSGSPFVVPSLGNDSKFPSLVRAASGDSLTGNSKFSLSSAPSADFNDADGLAGLGGLHALSKRKRSSQGGSLSPLAPLPTLSPVLEKPGASRGGKVGPGDAQRLSGDRDGRFGNGPGSVQVKLEEEDMNEELQEIGHADATHGNEEDEDLDEDRMDQPQGSHRDAVDSLVNLRQSPAPSSINNHGTFPEDGNEEDTISAVSNAAAAAPPKKRPRPTGINKPQRQLYREDEADWRPTQTIKTEQIKQEATPSAREGSVTVGGRVLRQRAPKKYTVADDEMSNFEEEDEEEEELDDGDDDKQSQMMEDENEDEDNQSHSGQSTYDEDTEAPRAEVKKYTPAEKAERIRRWKIKKPKLKYATSVRYKCRKQFATTRRRVGGRFVAKTAEEKAEHERRKLEMKAEKKRLKEEKREAKRRAKEEEKLQRRMERQRKHEMKRMQKRKHR